MHPQQDSATFPEKHNRLKEDYVVQAVEGTGESGHIKMVVAKQRAKRAAERVGKALIGGTGPRNLLAKISEEGKDIPRGWFLFYLMYPLHLAKVYMVRQGFH